MHLYLMRLKSLFRVKSILFWTMLFPILLSTLFYFAFSNLSDLDNYDTINLAIINGEDFPEEFVDTIKTVKFNSERNMFNVIETDHEDAKNLLDQNDITGFIKLDSDSDQLTLTIKNSGYNATILKAFLDEYLQTDSIITSIIIESQGEIDVETLLTEINNQKQYLNFESDTNTPNQTLLYFYSLLAMTLINGSLWGILEISYLQPNISTHGIRLSVSSTKRFKLLISNFMAVYTIHLLEIALFMLYLVFFLDVSFGGKIPYIILLSLFGSFTGISFGAFICISLKNTHENVKVAISTMVGVFGGFLSGMMYPNMKYIINTKAPIIGYINPVNIITDGFYSLYYYTSLNRYFLNITILIVMITVFVALTSIQFRRDNYDSI